MFIMGAQELGTFSPLLCLFENSHNKKSYLKCAVFLEKLIYSKRNNILHKF